MNPDFLKTTEFIMVTFPIFIIVVMLLVSVSPIRRLAFSLRNYYLLIEK